MADSDLYEARFAWPHPEPKSVIVTGTFDDWSASVRLTKTPSGFEGTAKVPWGQKIKYKFVVDGQWVTHEDQPTEIDPGGFVNNIFTSPPKPAEPEPTPTAVAPAIIDSVAVETPVKEIAEPVTNGHATNGHTVATEIAEEKPVEPAAGPKVEAASPEHKEGENDTSAAPNIEPKDPAAYPRLLSDLADTIAARDGTSSALDYVASGLGAAMHSVVGVDPINAQKIAIPTPKPDDAFSLPAAQESVPSTAELPPEPAPTSAADSTSPESSAPAFAPIVPIAIMTVNEGTNNTEPTGDLTGASAVAVAEDTASTKIEPSTHVPAVGDAPAGTELEAKKETASEQPAPEAALQGVDKQEQSAPEPAPARAVDTPALKVEEEFSGTTTSPAEEAAAEVKTEEPTAPEPPTAPEAPATEEKKEEPSVPTIDAIKASDPAVVPAIEEVVPEAKAEESAEEEKLPDVEAPAEEKPVQPASAEAALVPAAPTEVVPVKVEETAKEELASTSSAQELSTEVEQEGTGLAVVVPPLKEVAVVEPALDSLSASTFAVEETKPEGSKDEPAKPASNEVAAEPTPAPQVEVQQEAAPAPSKEDGSTAQTSTEPAQPAVEAAPAAKEEIPAAQPEAAPAPVEDKPAPTEAMATPSKNDQTFPSTSESPATGSPSSSRFNSVRKKRTSIFGKLKNIFHHDKEK